MMIPVYLFTGFLESGKTCFILSVLNDPTFNDGSKTLLIVCEEGMTEYDEDYLAEKLNTKIVYVEKMEDLNYHLLNQLKKNMIRIKFLLSIMACGPYRIYLNK